MNNSPIIRFANPGDAEALVLLCKAHAHYEKATYDPTGKHEALTKSLLASPPAFYCLVAELHNKLIGYATYMPQFSTWDACSYIYMDCLFLNEKSRGLGIGEKLMHRIKTEAQKLGIDLIQWQTPDFNTSAIRFYQRIGAVAKTKERFFWEVG